MPRGDVLHALPFVSTFRFTPRSPLFQRVPKANLDNRLFHVPRSASRGRTSVQRRRLGRTDSNIDKGDRPLSLPTPPEACSVRHRHAGVHGAEDGTWLCTRAERASCHTDQRSQAPFSFYFLLNPTFSFSPFFDVCGCSVFMYVYVPHGCSVWRRRKRASGLVANSFTGGTVVPALVFFLF